jgi:hypothetical protein
MGKVYWIAGLLCSMMFSVSFAQEDAAKEEVVGVTVSATANYGTWSSAGGDNKGSQGLGYFQAAYDAKNWGLAVTGKAASTSYKTVLSDERLDFTTLTDASVSTYYSHIIGDLMLRGGVDFSLPTGKHAYTNSELGKIITDPLSQDLMMVNTYGAGTNIITHFLAIQKISDQLTIGGGARYEFTGSYDPTTDVSADIMDPGDRLMIMANAALMLTDNDYLLLTAMFNRSGVDKQDGKDIFKTGDTYSIEARYIRKWEEAFNSILSVSYHQQDKNEMPTEGNVLNSELSNSNNNSWEAYVNNVYRYSDDFSFTGVAGYKQVFANGRKQDEPLYDGGRWKAYVEPGVMWFLSQTNYLSSKIRYSYIFDKKDAFSSDDSGYNVFNVDIGYTYSF